MRVRFEELVSLSQSAWLNVSTPLQPALIGDLMLRHRSILRNRQALGMLMMQTQESQRFYGLLQIWERGR